MAGEINRVPAGLLSILDMKTRGQSPRELASQLQGTVELRDLYLQGQRATLQSATNFITAPSNFTIAGTVNQDLAFYVHNATVMPALVLAAGTSYRFSFAYQWQGPGDSLARNYTHGPKATGVAGEWPITNTGFVPFLLLPGWRYGVATEQVTVGTSQQFVVRLDYTPISL